MPTITINRVRDAKIDALLRAAREYADVDGCEHAETKAEAFALLRSAALAYDASESDIEARRAKPATKAKAAKPKPVLAGRPVPEVGARWQITAGTMGGTMCFRIDALDAINARVTFDGRREGALSRQTLSKGLRGARPVRVSEVAA